MLTRQESADPKFNIVSEVPENHWYPIRPRDIDIAHGLPSTFGKHEIEKAAAQLVSFCQKRGGWYSFTIGELMQHYRDQNLSPDAMFFGLIGLWLDDARFTNDVIESWQYLAVDIRGRYSVTELFIKRCAKQT
ncbi:MAG: hypothetical protein HY006_00105 [Candidatus Sungbacteria bacterium]|nr:hypothetical protein [Candidatus Sungbacteria bacterium]